MNMEIKNLSDVATMMSMVDVAEEVPVYWGSEKQKSTRFKGVKNLMSNKLAQVVSSNYKIIQHTHAVQAVVEALDEKNIQVSGMANNEGNNIRLNLVFGTEDNPIKDDADGIKIGIRVLNSFDKSSSFRLEMFAFRMICQNGMALGHVMNGIKKITVHMGEEKTLPLLKRITKKFIDSVINSSVVLQKYVNYAMTDSIDYKEAMEVFENLIKAKKHRKAIAEILNLDVIEVEQKHTKKKKFLYQPKEYFKPLSRWDFYNAVTNYATHSINSMNTENQIQNVAQKILKQRTEKLVATVRG